MDGVEYGALLGRFTALWYYARACQLTLEIGYYYKNLFVEHYDPEATDLLRNLRANVGQLQALVREARLDMRLRGLEIDVYREGMEDRILERAEQFCDDVIKALQSRGSCVGEGLA
ncbi:MAG: hypothetical protein GY700_13615 [Propionibacteriaceae bacterium]|nr:hypothetical protein [Propionibacteriaceae bacterium]